jgi:demethylmenaquinone methyltransferase/2-methoxy-6-polyprenyl-1,4-benzoquinol methylase
MRKSHSNELDQTVEETKEYYRQRASQYSDWAHRTGQYEDDVEPEASWFDEAVILIEALASSGLSGDVLEIASGTGIWTEELLRNAASVTALDPSPEMHERSRSRLMGNPKVRYVVADIYNWVPDMSYDAVTFSFWLSHVPGSKLDDFVSKVSRCLKLGGRVFFADQRKEGLIREVMDHPGGKIARRSLVNGREFKIIKHFYSSEEIIRCFFGEGINISISNTATLFYYASGVKYRDQKSQVP